MTRRRLLTEFVPGRGYTEDDWEEATNIPDSTADELAQARPFAEVFPEMAEKIRKTMGRPKLEKPKKKVTLRLDADVLEHYRAGGEGWQTRINETLRKAIRP